MTENGKPVDLIKVTLEGGSMSIKFAEGVNLALISHAARLVDMQINRMIVANDMKNKQTSVIPASQMNSIIKNMRG